MKDVPAKGTGSQYTAEEFEKGLNEETKNFVESSDQALSEADQFQMGKTAANYSSAGDFSVDSGAADAYVLSAISPYQAQTKFIDGMRLRFRPVNPNTGASTVNPFTLGVKDIKHETGRDLLPGELVTGKEVEIIYRQSSDYFIISDIVINNLPKDYRSGTLLVNNGADPTKDIDFQAGEWRSSDNTTNLILTSTMVKQIDANWAAGTNAGGFPSGLTLTADTDYHCFLIGKEDGTTDAGFDSDINAVNLLADATGYDKYVRVGTIRTDASSNILEMCMFYEGKSRVCYWYDSTKEYDVTNPGTSAILISLKTPPNVSTNALFTFELRSASVSSVVYFTPICTIDKAPAPGLGHGVAIAPGDEDVYGQEEIFTDTSNQIRARLSASDANTRLIINTIGWKE